MRVTMTGFAKQQIRETAIYIQKEFGKKYAERFLHRVQTTRQQLATNPHLGSVEPLLAECTSTYRSIVVTKLNKMVYRILDDQIEVVDFWDTRREPLAQAAQVK